MFLSLSAHLLVYYLLRDIRYGVSRLSLSCVGGKKLLDVVLSKSCNFQILWSEVSDWIIFGPGEFWLLSQEVLIFQISQTITPNDGPWPLCKIRGSCRPHESGFHGKTVFAIVSITKKLLYRHTGVLVWVYVHFFVLSVACTKQVTWAPVHMQVCFLVIAFITCNRNLVPLFEGLYSSNPCRFDLSVLSFCRNRTDARD